MTRKILSDRITIKVTGQKLLKMYRNQQTKHLIKKVRFHPPVLGSESLGSFEVTINYEPKSTIRQTI